MKTTQPNIDYTA